MTDVDWSQAPASATHYDSIMKRFCTKGGYWEKNGRFQRMDALRHWIDSDEDHEIFPIRPLNKAPQ